MSSEPRPPLRLLLLLLLLLLLWPQLSQAAGLLCLNGGTYDDLQYYCHCTPFFHGVTCNRSFFEFDPCQRVSELPTLNDSAGAHRVGNVADCDGSGNCVNFASISTGWYRVASPAGDYIIDSYACLNGSTQCGSRSPFILRQQLREANPTFDLVAAKAFRYDERSAACYFADGTSFPVRVLRCSPQLRLYFLTPMLSSRHHFCVGDAARCADGSGYSPPLLACGPGAPCQPSPAAGARPPSLRLLWTAGGVAEFRCNFFADFTVGGGDSVKYNVTFGVLAANGSFFEVSACRVGGQSLAAGANRTVACAAAAFWTPRLLGARFLCRLDASCASAADGGASARSLWSNPLHLAARYRLLTVGSSSEEAGRLTPTQPLRLCVDAATLPETRGLRLRLTVGQGAPPGFRVFLASGDSTGAGSCDFLVANGSSGCHFLQLRVSRSDELPPLGLDSSQLQAQVLLQLHADVGDRWLLLDSRQLSLSAAEAYGVAGAGGLARVATPGLLKPATASYQGLRTLAAGWQSLLRHSCANYEFKLFAEAAGELGGAVVASEVTLSYGGRDLQLRGVDSAGACHLQLEGANTPLSGVEWRRSGSAVRLRLRLFGAELLAWLFRRRPSAGSCGYAFFMDANSMPSDDCPADCSEFVRTAGGRLAMEVQLRPGLQDTAPAATGLALGASDTRDCQVGEGGDGGGWRAGRVLRACACSHDKPPADSAVACLADNSTGTPSSSASSSSSSSSSASSSSSSSSSGSLGFSVGSLNESEARAACSAIADGSSRNASVSLCRGVVGSDFVDQFVNFCTRQAVGLGSARFAAAVLDGFLRLCERTVARSVEAGAAEQLRLLRNDRCPADCSGRGSCLYGFCNCRDAFAGASCDQDWPTVNNTVGIVVSVDDLPRPVAGCADCGLLMLVVGGAGAAPEDAECVVTPSLAFVSAFAVTAVRQGSSFVCDIGRVHRQLVSLDRLYVSLSIQLKAIGWRSSNNVTVLAHRSRCGHAGVECSLGSGTCHNGTVVQQPVDGNRCFGDVEPKAAIVSRELLLPLLLLPLLPLLLLGDATLCC